MIIYIKQTYCVINTFQLNQIYQLLFTKNHLLKYELLARKI